MPPAVDPASLPPSASIFTGASRAGPAAKFFHAGSTLPLAEAEPLDALPDEPSADPELLRLLLVPLPWCAPSCDAPPRGESPWIVPSGESRPEKGSVPAEGTGDGRPASAAAASPGFGSCPATPTVGDRAIARRARRFAADAACGAAAGSIGAAGLMWAAEADGGGTEAGSLGAAPSLTLRACVVIGSPGD